MARLLLVSEPNLHRSHDAYLPPSWCNLGTAQLAGYCRARGHVVSLYSFFPSLIEAAALAPRGRAWLLDRASADAPTLSKMLAVRGRAWADRRLEEVLAGCQRPAARDFLFGPNIAGLALLLKDVLILLERHIGDPEHPFLNHLVAAAKQFSPDWVGISLSRAGEPLVEAMIEGLAGLGLPVVVGGVAAERLPAAEEARLLDDLGARRIVRGPGEIPLAALIEDRPDPGASPEPEHPAEPAFDLLDLDRFYFPERVLPIRLSRGCYWKRCAYCRREVCGDDWQPYDAEGVADSVLALSERFGVRAFSINDLAIPPRQARAFSRAILERQGGESRLSFFGAARPERVFTRALLAGQMARAGFKVIFWGIESGSASVLRRMAKGSSPATAGRVLEDAHAAGITNLCFFMAGFPGETEEDWQKTLEFWEEHHRAIAYNRVNPFVLEPGSLVFEDPGRYGVELGAPGQHGDSVSYSVRSGLTPERARALKVRLLDEKARGLRRIDHGRLFEPPLLGDGDEKLPFFVAQRLLGARLLGQEDSDVARESLIALTPRAAALLEAAPPGPLSADRVREATRGQRFLVLDAAG